MIYLFNLITGARSSVELVDEPVGDSRGSKVAGVLLAAIAVVKFVACSDVSIFELIRSSVCTV